MMISTRIFGALFISVMAVSCHMTVRDKTVPSAGLPQMDVLKLPAGAQPSLSLNQFYQLQDLYELKADSATISAALHRFRLSNDSLQTRPIAAADTVKAGMMITDTANWSYSYLTPDFYLGMQYDSATGKPAKTYRSTFVTRGFFKHRKTGLEINIPFTYTVQEKPGAENRLILHIRDTDGTISLLNLGEKQGMVQSAKIYNLVFAEKNACWVNFSGECLEKRKVPAQPGSDGTIFSNGDFVPAPGTKLTKEDLEKFTLNSNNILIFEAELRMSLAPESRGPFSKTNRPRLQYIAAVELFSVGPR